MIGIFATTAFMIWFLVDNSAVLAQVCPSGWLDRPGGDSCYKIATLNIAKTWQDAQMSCTSYQGDLVVINSAAEQNWMKAQLMHLQHTDTKTYEWWYGANDRNKDNKWRWVDGTPLSNSDSIWRDSEPNNHGGGEHCAQMWIGGLNDNDCSTLMPYVCERSKNLTLECDIDNGWEHYQQYCYKFFSNLKNWNGASQDCDSRGGRLVTVLIDSIERHVTDMARSHTQNTWIGLHSVPDTVGVKWKWVWNDLVLNGGGYWGNTTGSYIPKGQENSSCVEVNSGTTSLQAWGVVNCNQRKSYLCEKPEGVCAPGWIQYQTKCYEIKTNLPLTWSQADRHCKSHGRGASLVEITSQAEQSFLNAFFPELSESGTRQLWIGLTDRNKGWFMYSSGKKLGPYLNWIKTPPSQNPQKNDCGLIFSDDRLGKWSTTSNCLQLKSFICQIPSDTVVRPVTTPAPTKSCDKGWVQYINRCFLFKDTAVNWMAASSVCNQQDAHLAKVPDNDTQGFLNGHISTSVWIGLTDRVQEGHFKWRDYSAPLFLNWNANQPDNSNSANCVGMVNEVGHKGQWDDQSCSTKMGYVCQKRDYEKYCWPCQTATAAGITAAPKVRPTPSWSPNCGPLWEEDASLGFCYSFRDHKLTWQDARLWCTHHGGDLASISSIQEQYFVAGRIRGDRSFAVWIGANDMDKDGGWQWTDGSAFSYINWKSGEPNNVASEDCVNMVTTTGLWNDFDCNARNGFVCKKSNGLSTPSPPTTQPTTIPAGFVMGCPDGWVTFKGSCYLIKKEQLDYANSLLKCRQLDADLASINDDSEQNFLKSQFHSSWGHSYWIGLNDRVVEGTFKWTDGSKTEYTHWQYMEPNGRRNREEDCVAIYGYNMYGWNDNTCSFQASGYICKSRQKPVPRTTQAPGCPKGSNLYYGKCYLFIEMLKSWSNAEDHCKTMSGHLATISDRYIQAYISSELSGKAGSYWIGLSDQKNNGKYIWADNQNLTFTIWTRSHTGKEVNSCVVMVTTKPVGLWENLKCYMLNGFICQVTQGGYTTAIPTTTVSTLQPVHCAADWHEFHGYCYQAFYKYGKTNKLMWTEAEANCVAYGAHLASFHNETDETFLKNTVFRAYWGGDFWIGLSERDMLQGLSWTDDSPFDYDNWSPGQPNNPNNMANCVAFSANSNTWNSVNCYVANSWVCRVRKGIVLPTSVTPPTAATSPSCGGPDSKWVHYKGMCYYVSDMERKTWYKARDWCQDNGGYLTSIHSQAEDTLLLSLIAKKTYGTYWIGLNELDAGTYRWADSTGVDFINWSPNEPNDAEGGQRCVNFYQHNGAWNDDNCADENEFICKKVNGSYSAITMPPTTIRPGNCPSGSYGFKSKCFHFGGQKLKDRLNWTDARMACQALGDNYDLASVADADEQAFITSKLPGFNISMWIGLHDRFTESKFKWLDNSDTYYHNWNQGEPSGDEYIYNYGGSMYPPGRFRYPYDYNSHNQPQDCVEMYAVGRKTGKWNDADCVSKLGYICHGFKDTSVPKPKSTALPSWCKSGYTVFQQSCYKVLANRKTWAQAKVLCQQDDANLVSITDAYEQGFVKTITHEIAQPVWIGLSDTEVSGVYRWVDIWPVDFSNWGRNEPSKGEGEGCVSFLPDGKWNDTLCNQRLPAVCEISTGTPPPPLPTFNTGKCGNTTWGKWGDSCYYVDTQTRKSWPEARFECERKGMTLASVHSQLESKFIQDYISRQPMPRFSFNPNNLWIGLLKGVTSGFQWADKTEVNFVSWEADEPSDTYGGHEELCVELHPENGMWNDIRCDSDMGFICKAPTVVTATPPPVQRVTDTPNVFQPTKKSTGPLPWHGPPTPYRNNPNIPDAGLSTGAIVCICVGVPLLLAIAAVIWFVVRRLRQVVYKTGSASVGFDNELYRPTTSAGGVDIQSNGNIDNGQLQPARLN